MAIKPKNYNDDNWFQKLFLNEAKAALDANKTGGGVIGPAAYTGYSVDELPADAVDGSLAIVEYESDILGTWVFSDTINMSYQAYTLDYTSNGKDFKQMTAYGSIQYMYADNGEMRSIEARSSEGIWTDDNYKTITITNAGDGAIVTWLNENATQTEAGKAQALYIRENGEWVYVKEVGEPDSAGGSGGELYEVDSVEELPEHAPNGSLALVETEGIPQSYTVSSVDELPADAVDGSMAIVNMEGKEWYLNEEVSGFADNEVHSMEFICSHDLAVLHKGIKYGTFGPPAYAISYTLDGDGTLTVYGFEGASQFGVTEGWSSESYRTVYVFSADEAAMAWLSTNGKETGNDGYYLQKFYIHENGQWVYVKEVGEPDKPLAYTVSSVDELPSNAVDGSLAVVNKHIEDWVTKTWNGLELPYPTGNNIWTDGTNTYYSNGETQKVLNGDTWEDKVWTGLTSFEGTYIWNFGGNTYYSSGSEQYVLSGDSWTPTTWTGLDGYVPNGSGVVTTDEYAYALMGGGAEWYECSKMGYIWTPCFWQGDFIPTIEDSLWTDGMSLHCSHYDAEENVTKHYVLSGDKWIPKTWNGLTEFYGYEIFIHNGYYMIHQNEYSYNGQVIGCGLYVLNGDTWEERECVWTNPPSASDIWECNGVLYGSSWSGQYVLAETTKQQFYTHENGQWVYKCEVV